MKFTIPFGAIVYVAAVICIAMVLGEPIAP